MWSRTLDGFGMMGFMFAVEQNPLTATFTVHYHDDVSGAHGTFVVGKFERQSNHFMSVLEGRLLDIRDAEQQRVMHQDVFTKQEAYAHV